MTTLTSLFLAALLLVGCSGAPGSQEDPEGEIGIAASDLVSVNALNMNALNMNALNMNALNMNALNMSSLSPINLAAIQAPTAVGELARQLLKYTVSCALDETQLFSFSWTDAASVVHSETYWGLLGLATKWSTKPLSASGQEWVSACLISRVNWYEAPVTISARGGISGLSVTGPLELIGYPREEGAFWGNLYEATPYAYSCSNPSNDGHSRALLRDCATGHLDIFGQLTDCGMIHRIGSCASYCNALTRYDGYYPQCQVPFGSNVEPVTAVVTVYLP